MSEDEDALLARALEILQRRARGASSTSTVTVAEIYKDWAAALKNHRSWKTIEISIRPAIKAFGDRQVMSLKVSDWSDHRAAREKEEIPTGKPGRFYGAHTLNLELSWFKAALNWAVLQGKIPHNPLVNAKPVKTKSKRSTAPSESDIEALLSESDVRLRVVVLCAADAGMRRTEIVKMRWDWIDRESSVIRLPGWACKSGKPRTVVATGRMLDAIDALPRHLRSPFVLTNPDTGEAYGTTTVGVWFRIAADGAGIEAAPADRRVVPHDLRRGYGTNAVRRGMRLDVVSKLLGHASLDQTREYVEVVDLDIEIARATFESGIERDRRRGPKRADDATKTDPAKSKGDAK